jgi:hypothetical protein
MAPKPNVRGAVGELSFIRPGRSAATTPSPAESDPPAAGATAAPAAQPGPAPASAPKAAKPRSRRSAAKADAALIRTEVLLPEDVAFRARGLVRPSHTGAERSLGAAFVLQGYVRALDELGLDLDVAGMDVGLEDEMVDRVKDALGRYGEREVRKATAAVADALVAALGDLDLGLELSDLPLDLSDVELGDTMRLTERFTRALTAARITDPQAASA